MNLTATAADNQVGVVGVQFLVTAACGRGHQDLGSPTACRGTPPTVSNGSHTLTARARDAAGNIKTSSAVSVTVDNTTAPTVSVTGPANGATVSGTVNLAATASDNDGVAGVQFLVDGVALGAEDTSSPYSVSWNTTEVANGSHTLTARARDAAGNTTTSSARERHRRQRCGYHGAHGEPHRARRRRDRVGHGEPRRHRLRQCRGGRGAVPGGRRGAGRRGHQLAPYGVSWNTATAANGSHTVAARARDAAGNTTTTPAVTVTVDNTAPSVSLTAPPAGPVRHEVTLAAAAADNVGVAGVQFLVDGTVWWAPRTPARPTACRGTPPRPATAPTR